MPRALKRAPDTEVGKLFEADRANLGWTYERLHEEVIALCEMAGITPRGEATVRFTCQGRAGEDAYRGERRMKPKEPSTMTLVAQALRTDLRKLARARAIDSLTDVLFQSDLYMQDMGTISRLIDDASMGYWKQTHDDQQVWAQQVVHQRRIDTHPAPIEAAS